MGYRSSRPSPFAPSTGRNSRTALHILLRNRDSLSFMLLLLLRHVSYKVRAGGRTALCKDHVARPNPQESDTCQYRYEPNAAATQKSESCGHRVRRSATQHATGGARAVEGSRLAAARWEVRTLRYVSSAYPSVSESQKHRQPMRTPSPRCSPMTTCGRGAAE